MSSVVRQTYIKSKLFWITTRFSWWITPLNFNLSNTNYQYHPLVFQAQHWALSIQKWTLGSLPSEANKIDTQFPTILSAIKKKTEKKNTKTPRDWSALNSHPQNEDTLPPRAVTRIQWYSMYNTWHHSGQRVCTQCMSTISLFGIKRDHQSRNYHPLSIHFLFFSININPTLFQVWVYC